MKTNTGKTLRKSKNRNNLGYKSYCTTPRVQGYTPKFVRQLLVRKVLIICGIHTYATIIVKNIDSYQMSMKYVYQRFHTFRLK